MRGGAVVSGPVTGSTITEADIRQLREEALAAGDDRQVEYCDIALAPYRFANDDGTVLVWPWNGQDADRTVARQVCAVAINASRDAASETGGES